MNKTLLLLLSFSFVLISSGTALATHKDPAIYGADSLQGHFGQPHGTEISGNFTFIVSASKSTDWVGFKLFSDSDPSYTNRLADYNKNAPSYVAPDSTEYYNLTFDSTTLPDGTYRLLANVDCKTCSGGGPLTDTVVHYDGKPYLRFKISNPVFESPTPVSEAPTPVSDGAGTSNNSCIEKRDEAKKIAESILKKYDDQQAFADNFMQQTTLFYQNNKLSVSDFDAIQKGMSDKRKIASDNLVELKRKAAFSCDNDLKTQVSDFLSVSDKVQSANDAYKDSVIEFILVILKEA